MTYWIRRVRHRWRRGHRTRHGGRLSRSGRYKVVIAELDGEAAAAAIRAIEAGAGMRLFSHRCEWQAIGAKDGRAKPSTTSAD